MPVYENQGLFSKHYLERLLRDRPEWISASEEARAVRTQLLALYRTHQTTLPKLKEPALEETWIRPILKTLGVVFEVQPSLPTDDRARTIAPDYACFETEDVVQTAREQRQAGTARDFFLAARLVGDAKRWGTDFAAAPGGERSPRQQLTEYLHLSGVDWGFLTDGRRWRLTHRSVAGRLDHYYEVDLVAALESESLDDFLYFFLFFNGAAIRRGPDGSPAFLDAVRAGSTQYAEAVGAELVDSVYEALRLLGRGFVVRLGPAALEDPELLRRECLTLLYRLLFLFYAEHRRLLPLDVPKYGQASLTFVARRIAEALDAGTGFAARRTSVWGQLTSLFELIDRGDGELGVPAYNGGLFSATEHPLLARSGPGDRDLAAAIDLLARTHAPSSADRHFIDYRDLDIRHLGSIYERLLEYRLEVASTDLAIVPKDDRRQTEQYVPFDATLHGSLSPQKRVSQGDTYLVTDRGERHASGSFYTPDFIVEHLVEQTLGPLVKDKTPDEVLRLRIVDTAMGSGHFLLEAVDYVAQAYATARAAEASSDAPASDGEMLLYRRLVAERCIYGVDLNPMAVELAKVGLWLKTMARDSALTFLNHNLKDGNSLLGSRVDDIGAHHNGNGKNGNGKKGRANPDQLDLFQRVFQHKLPAMIDDALKILALKTHSRQDVEAKERWDAAIDETRAGFLMVADVQSASLLGTKPADFDNLLLRLHKPQTVSEHPDVIQASEVAKTRRFFHWELMFPEVFFDKHGRRRPDAGFDVVIGNPPWVRQETLKRDKDSLKALYPEVYDGVADIYVFFVALGLRVLAPAGRLGLVLPNKWFRTDYAEKLRTFLPSAMHSESLVDFGHAPIFNEADTFPCLLVGAHAPETPGDLRFCPVPREALDGLDLPEFFERRSYRVNRKMLRADGWYPHPPKVARLIQKLWSRPRLEQVLTRSPYNGLKTGYNQAFLVDQGTRDTLIRQDPACEPILRKYYRGEDIERWSARWDGEWMLMLASSENKEWAWSGEKDPETAFQRAFPSVHRHMKQHEAKLRAREDQGRFWWELRSCDYYDVFASPKIVYQEIQFHSRFALDDEGYCLNNKAYMLPTADKGLLGALNSSLMWWYMWHTARRMKDEAFALQGTYMDRLPVLSVGSDLVGELLSNTRDRQEMERQLHAWLRAEFALTGLSQKLVSFWQLDEAGFLAELKKAGLKLSKADVQRAQQELTSTRKEYLPLLARSRDLERQLHDAVFAAYELTDREIALVKQTGAPRDPLALLDADA